MNEQETPKQEIRRLGYIVKHLRRLSPAGLEWVRGVCDELLRGRRD